MRHLLARADQRGRESRLRTYYKSRLTWRCLTGNWQRLHGGCEARLRLSAKEKKSRMILGGSLRPEENQTHSPPSRRGLKKSWVGWESESGERPRSNQAILHTCIKPDCITRSTAAAGAALLPTSTIDLLQSPTPDLLSLRDLLTLLQHPLTATNHVNTSSPPISC